MNGDDLAALVRQAADEDLPGLIGGLEAAKAVALARLTACASKLAEGSPAPADGQPLCIGVERVAELLELPASAVYELLRTKRLPGYKEGKYWQVPVAALEAHVRRRLEDSEGRTYRDPLKGGAMRAAGRG